jgi:hypothetical protein
MLGLVLAWSRIQSVVLGIDISSFPVAATELDLGFFADATIAIGWMETGYLSLLIHHPILISISFLSGRTSRPEKEHGGARS